MKRTAINLVSVIGGELLLRVANFAAIVVMARLYGAALLGSYAMVLAFVTVAMLAADNGLQTTAVKELSRGCAQANKTTTALYVAKVLLTALAIAVLVVVFRFRGLSRTIWFVAAFVIVRQVFQSFAQLQVAILKSLDRMLSIGVVQAIHSCFLMGGIIAAYVFKWPITILLTWLVGGQLLELILSYICIAGTHIRPNRIELADCYRLLWRSTPVGLAWGIAGFILRFDVIVLSAISSTEAVGRFAAAHMIFSFAYVLAWLLGSVLLPEMVRLAASDNESRQYAARWSARIFLTTVPVSLLCLAVAPALLPILYGREFSEAGKLLAILGLAIPFVLNNSIYFHRAIALNATSVFVGTYLATAVLAVGLSMSLGTLFGSSGIAWAIVIREVGMFAAFRVLASRGRYGFARAEVSYER